MNFYEQLFNKGKPAGEGMTHFERLFALKLSGGSGGEIKELEGVPPLTFKADGSPLIDWYIKGNTIQNGTPTPQNPVDVNGTGERTGNLFDKTTVVIGERVYTDRVAAEAGFAHSDFIDISGADFITVSQRAGITTFYFYTDKSNQSISYYQGNTAEVPNNAKYVRINMSVDDVNSNMLVIGSTAPTSYIPYGYKIPISMGGTTTPVYLGEVQTERKIQKLVLTGEENIENAGSGIKRFTVSGYLQANGNIPICTHYIGQDTVGGSSEVGELQIAFLVSSSGNNFMYIRDSSYTVDTFKAYLQQQYAAGTPVTVWYVLATPQTAIVNEPLMKIGNYADSLTATQAGTEIATVKGSNTLDIDTTVKPSNVYIKYKD